MVTFVKAYGMYWSDDSGASWTAAVTDLPSDIIDCGSSSEECVTQMEFLESGVVVASTQDGVWGSTDGGETWVDVSPDLYPRHVASLAVSPDGMTVYAGTRGGGVVHLAR